MSDFLTRMAQYSRGEAGVVTPVLAGIFGPQAEPEPVETVVDVSRREGNSVQPDAERAIPVVVAEREILQQPVVQKRAEPGQSSVAEPVYPQPERGWGGDVQPAFTPESISAATPLADLHDLAHSHRVVDNQMQPSSVVGLISAAEKAFQPAAATENSDAPPVADILLASKQVAVTAEPASLLVPRESNRSLPGETQSVSQHDLIDLTPLAGQGVQKEPAIHISIGRIEVRAQTPPPVSALPRSRPKSESSLSLSAYLKRGGGGL